MSRPSFKGILNLDNADSKRRLLSWAGRLTGFYECDLRPRRDSRTLRQNAFWWACVVQPFAEFLKEQEFTLSSTEDAHLILREKFLRAPVCNANGEVLSYVTRGTSSLTAEEFGQLIEAASAWLAEQFGIIVPEPDVMHGLAAAAVGRAGA